MAYPELAIAPDHLKKIAAIERLAGGLRSPTGLGEHLGASLRRRSLIASTTALLRLEGRVVDLEEVKHVLAAVENHQLNLSRHSEEILRLFACLDTHTAEGEKDRQSIGVADLQKIHTSLFHGVPAYGLAKGALRDERLVLEAFDVQGKSVGDVFAGAPPRKLPGHLQEAFAGFSEGIAERRWHPLLLISWLLARLLSMQPFQFGSLRTSHLVCDLLLLEHGYPFVRMQSLEEIMTDDAGNYFVSLRRYQQTLESGEGGLGSWHSFFLACLLQQAVMAESLVRGSRERADLPLLQQDLIGLLRAHGKLTLKDVSELTGANRNTLKAHLKGLVARGILNRKGTGKGTWYELG